MQALVLAQLLIENSQNKIDFWQVLEQKSAFTEGVLASNVLFWNQFLNLKIAAGMFVAIKGPLESFFTKTYLLPVRSELDYIEQRVKLISDCKKLLKKYPKNSAEYDDIDNALWLLKFQLFGFGQRLITDDKILYGLIALKESGSLENAQIAEKIKRFAEKSPRLASIISEFF